MIRELIAHGYSNVVVGLCRGLQNYMAYTQSVFYDCSGGDGDATVNLILEGVYDSIGKFDILKYLGVWLITLVMTFLRYERGNDGGDGEGDGEGDDEGGGV